MEAALTVSARHAFMGQSLWVRTAVMSCRSCTSAPRFVLVPSRRYPRRGFNLAVANASTATEASISLAGMCVDAMGCFQAQLYKCLDSANQGWTTNVSARTIHETFNHNGSILGLSTDPACEPAVCDTFGFAPL